MTRRAPILALLLLLPLASIAATPRVGDTAPAFEGSGRAEQRIRFDPARRDRPALLLFWATWCPYCKALMPALQDLRARQGNAALDVFALDFREDEDVDPAAFLDAAGYDFTLVREADAIAAAYGVRGTPALFLTGRDGRVLWIRPNGAEPESVVQAIEARLAETDLD